MDLRKLLQHKILPLHENEKHITVGISQNPTPHTVSFLSLLSQQLHKQIIPIYTPAITLEDNIQHFLTHQKTSSTQGLGPLHTFVGKLISDAYAQKCSDLHFEPRKTNVQVRFRRQGQLMDVQALDRQTYVNLTNFLKINAHLDPNQKQMPQDGHITIHHTQIHINCRLSCLPSLYGESLVLRLLPQDIQNNFSLSQLGLEQSPFIQKMRHNPQGLWLITGPIGNGKTTTYYSILHELCKSNKRVVSLENPIEIPNDAFTQINLLPNANVDDILRHLLRQSVDVLGIGEIRESTLLTLAITAALSGHCVIATMHASDSASVLKRLGNWGYHAPSHFLSGIAWQTLIPVPCPHCKPHVFCPECHDTHVLSRRAQFTFY